MICICQVFPPLRIGFLITYIGPLIFVLCITLVKEAIDDIKRYRRDKEINGVIYQKLGRNGEFTDVTSADISVGNIIRLQEKTRIPADMVLLQTSKKNGSIFIKTDQLDGETDWKLRKAIPPTQNMDPIFNLFQLRAYVRAQLPQKDIYNFQGTFISRENERKKALGLDLENTLWANTVLANGSAYGLVIYTGADTKFQLNSRNPRTKSGIVDNEVSFLSFLLFVLLMIMSLLLITLNGYQKNWYLLLMRYVLLLSYIIPISLRVNLDLAKAWYSYNISSDTRIVGTVARNTTIPEELGRIQVLMSDKTGTLTRNEMIFKSLYVGQSRYDKKDLDEIKDTIANKFKNEMGFDSKNSQKEIMVKLLTTTKNR